MMIPIHNISYSRINGPGNRIVIWVQGCPLRCVGCFNPKTHSFVTKTEMRVIDLVKQINSNNAIEGITISGGEPLLYPQALIELLNNIDKNITKILYSGYTVEEIIADELKSRVLKFVDLAIVGRYDKKLTHPYLGKKFLNITGKIDLNSFLPKFQVEYFINNDKVTKSGIFKE